MVQATIRFEGQKGLDAALSRLAVLGRSPRPIFKAIANYGESSTRLRFEHQRGPDGATWKPAAESRSPAGRRWSEPAPPSQHHQRLWRKLRSLGQQCRLRPHPPTGRGNQPRSLHPHPPAHWPRGNLVRQPGNRKLAVFARDSHKRARTSWHEIGPTRSACQRARSWA